MLWHHVSGEVSYVELWECVLSQCAWWGCEVLGTHWLISKGKNVLYKNISRCCPGVKGLPARDFFCRRTDSGVLSSLGDSRVSSPGWTTQRPPEVLWCHESNSGETWFSQLQNGENDTCHFTGLLWDLKWDALKMVNREFPDIQWLGLCIATTGGPGSIPWWGN